MVNVVLLGGTVNVAADVQLQVPEGIVTVVVDAVTALNAAWTADVLQLAALIVCALDGRRAIEKSIKAKKWIGLTVMVSTTPRNRTLWNYSNHTIWPPYGRPDE